MSDLGIRDTPEEFYSAVSESSSKLTLYSSDFIKDLLGQGEMASLLPIISGLALMRNKIWIYNHALIVEGKAKPFDDQYR